MTVAMELMHRLLPFEQRHPLPPRQITMQLARRAQVAHHMDEGERTAATLTAHFGYGTMVGSMYGLLCREGVKPGLLSGTLYGLTVWATSYLGILPALGILKPATRHPPQRNALMIAAHVVWGCVLGGLTRWLHSKEVSR
jgi:uncharacterized membrane protein YagU involved in acid resistance